MTLDEDELLNHLMRLVGIRAPIVAAAVLQLIVELRRAMIFDEDAVERIKEAIVRAAVQVRPSHTHVADFEIQLRTKLDRLFAASEAPRP
ncbi:hypothetical protein KRR38_27620 [Novosphingobium sp. G106]|uniref:hypothetical protein n=1 Tax=Novosphingobium sp. G106 TaxID=2849500 RepID=UPI001C2D4987|nr:hypothetical protein [Novosphingobium sp. G106]MBV1691352.1 hypothetical protein [Novosphingobium sp. G106]